MVAKKSTIVGWRCRKSRYLLQGVTCTGCAALYYPKKYWCVCGATSFEPVNFSGRGTLISFTSITVPPQDFIAMAPYNLGLVELEEGPRLIAQVTDVAFDVLTIGMPVVAVFRKHYAAGEKGIIHYGMKFKPIDLPIHVQQGLELQK